MIVPAQDSLLRRVARRAKATVAPRAVILLYHRIADAPADADPFNLCVSPARFAEQMEFLRRTYRVWRLSKLAAAIADGHMPYRSAVVTFDDGYADNLHTAKPILERHDVPATVFATTGAVGRAQEFYWDDCERLILAAPAADRRLEMTTGRARGQWNLVDAKPSVRRRICLEVCDLIRDLPPDARRECVADIRTWVGVPAAPVRETHRAMTDDELSRLAAGGLIEVGAHTDHHPALPSLPPVEQLGEIRRSKGRLESVLGGPVDAFAYPYGLHDGETVDAVKQAGFRWACTTKEHAARLSSEALRLPRFDMGDCGGEEFERKLRWAFGR